MSNKFNYFVAFSLGAAAGAVVAWKMLKTRYEQQTREEIDSVIEYYKEKYSEKTDTDDRAEVKDEAEAEDESDEDPVVAERKTEYKDYLTTIRSNSYAHRDYSNNTIEKKAEERIEMDKPYVIAPDEFGEFDGYETETLIFYSDRVLTDEMGNLVEDVSGTIGDALTHFGEYEDDSVHVRNDLMRTDYEILRDESRYRDIWKSRHGSEA